MLAQWNQVRNLNQLHSNHLDFVYISGNETPRMQQQQKIP